MNYQHVFSRIVGIALSLVLLGLLSLTAYAAGPVPVDLYQAIPVANHCAGISNDAAGSTVLAANPELATACRFAGMGVQQPATGDTSPAENELSRPGLYQRTIDELARQQNFIAAHLHRADLEPDAINATIFAAANPEVMKAQRYATAE